MDLPVNVDVDDLARAIRFCFVEFLGRGHDELASA